MSTERALRSIETIAGNVLWALDQRAINMGDPELLRTMEAIRDQAVAALAAPQETPKETQR